MTSAEKQLLVQEAMKHGTAGRESLREMSERLREEIESKLLAEGVPLDLLLYMRGVQEQRQLTYEVARNMFPVQALPDGALPIFERDPEVARLVVEDEPEAGS